MKEIVVISGKGGTGKTSIVASYAVLAKDAVLADCDVDASDLHLILSPMVSETHVFQSGRVALIRGQNCTRCGVCMDHCRYDAVLKTKELWQGEHYTIDAISCEGCGVCVRFCPENAIDFSERTCGQWYVSATRCGLMVHARLDIGAENSGKLVTIVRSKAQQLAREQGKDLVIVDGSPGIGCPVIASITGASLVVVVTEPTLSGVHDMKRVLELGRHFNVRSAVCVNKWDLNPEIAEDIEHEAARYNAPVIGRIHYDRSVTQAQVNGQAVVEHTDTLAAHDIRKGWEELCHMIA